MDILSYFGLLVFCLVRFLRTLPSTPMIMLKMLTFMFHYSADIFSTFSVLLFGILMANN